MSDEEKYDSSRPVKEKMKTRTIVLPKIKKGLKPKTTPTKEASPRKYEFKPKMIDNKFYVDLSDYTVKEQRKKGSDGSVYIINDKLNDKTTLVAKVFTCSGEKKTRHYILRQISILIHIQHPTIVDFKGFSFNDFEDNKDNITIIMNYAENDSLAHIIKDCPTAYNNTKRQIILIGVSRSLMLLHKRHIVHGNIKAEKVLLEENYYPQITDIGYYKHLNSEEVLKSSTKDLASAAYMAPETIKDGVYTTKTDVYSFGILMFEVLARRRAYENDKLTPTKLVSKVLNENYRPKFDFEIKEGLKKIIEACWADDPNERPTFQEIFNKLSMSENDELIDFEINDFDPVIKDSDSSSFGKYLLDDVDEDEIFLYVQDILCDTTMAQGKQNIKIPISPPLSRDSSSEKLKIADFSGIPKEEDDKLKNVEDQIELLKGKIEELNNEIILLKSEKDKDPKLPIPEAVLPAPHVPATAPAPIEPSNSKKQEDLQNQCFELKRMVDAGILPAVRLPNFLFEVPSSLFEGNNLLSFIEIPPSVISIKDCAFKNCPLLKSIEIPPSVRHIENNAFNGCTSLVTIKIPESVKSIGYSAFSGCTALRSIDLPNTVALIGFCAFFNCSKLEKFKFPSSATQIEDGTFYGCSSLERIEIPSSITSFGYRAFYECKALKKIKLPPKVKIIREGVFYGCSELSSIINLDNILAFEDGCFFGCTSIESIKIPEAMTTIGNNLFNGCSSLEEIEIPNSITSIGDSSFVGCTSLRRIEIPSSVESIGSNAFNKCSSLKSIEIPVSVKSIGKGVFNNCSSLAKITINSKSKITIIPESSFEGCSSLTSINLPATLIKIGSSAFKKCTHLNNIKIPSSVKEIGKDAFQDCSSIGKINLPSNINLIDDNIFIGCTSLTSINIPSSVKAIGNCAFQGCKSLEEIKLPSITSIGNYAFQGCSSLASIEIPSTVETIGEGAFQNCTSFTCAIIPESVKNFGKEIFIGCSNLEEVSINLDMANSKQFNSKAITHLTIYTTYSCALTGNYFLSLFESIPQITHLVIKPSFNSIDNYFFTELYVFSSSLISIEFPKTMKTVNYSSFSMCSKLNEIILDPYSTNIDWNEIMFDPYSSNINHNYNLTISTNNKSIDEKVKQIGYFKTITIPSTVTLIDKNTFQNYSNLVKINIPDSVSKIGAEAFSGCTGLTAINIPSSVKVIEDYVFYNCTQLQDITIDPFVTEIKPYAFYDNNRKGNSKNITISTNATTMDNTIMKKLLELFEINTLTICQKVKTIKAGTFDGCNNIIRINILSPLKIIEANTFNGCTSLTDFKIPSTVKSIGDYAFLNCTSLQNIEVPPSVEIIGKNSFQNCTSLQNVKLHSAVKSIGCYAFDNCQKLTKILIPRKAKVGDDNRIYVREETDE